MNSDVDSSSATVDYQILRQTYTLHYTIHYYALQEAYGMQCARHRVNANTHRVPGTETTLLLRDSLSLSRSFLLWLQP